MSFQKFKTNSYCVGQKHYSGTKDIVGEITFIKKTGREIEILVGQYSACNRTKSLIVSDNSIQADFFKKIDKSSVKVGKKLAENVLKNRSRALDNTAKIAPAAASTSLKNVLSTLLEVINFYHTGKGLYLGKFV